MNRPNGKYALPEMWGGIECTVNRVENDYFEQLLRTGHVDRPEDLDLFASLGIKAIRYPVLWEQIAPDGLENADWSWSDRQLARLRELGVRPIVGLVHHGSGPRDTSLTDPLFPERLAVFAEAVAHRYPWVEDYTPVNEPLTTARFSALYGHWYPHHRDDLNFARALLGQTRAVALSMAAIRKVNPAARLVQTDDLGRTYATAALAYQADFENERRWLTYDLLAGSLTRRRPMWDWLRYCGAEESELEWFLANPCTPDILGFNTYLSSERYLDERIDLYPGEPVGTNGQHTYVDVLAARVLPGGLMGTRGLLGEAWDRYGLPLAVTEVHNGSGREEQLRWLAEVWQGANEARQAGADVRAVTVWALLGLFDWPNLVTRRDDVYEPGVFDIRGPSPRPTAVARMVADLATKGQHRHPVLQVPGWWRRPDRFWYGHDVAHGRTDLEANGAGSPFPDAQPVLIIGERNRLRRVLENAFTHRAIPFVALDDTGQVSRDLDRICQSIDETRAWTVIDAGFEHRYPGGEGETVPWTRVSSANLPTIARACAARRLPLVSFSSDIVFDGRQAEPYTEDASVSPADAAGACQVCAETEAMRILPDVLIVRTGPLFGNVRHAADVPATYGRDGFRASSTAWVDGNEIVSPTYLDDLVQAAIDLLLDGERGIWHLTHGTAVSWAEFQRLASGHGQPDGATFRLKRSRSAVTRVPATTRVMESNRGWLLPTLQDAVARCFEAS